MKSHRLGSSPPAGFPPNGPAKHPRGWRALPVLCCAAFATLLGSCANSAKAAPIWPADPDWQAYVESPVGENVTPVKVVKVSGDVQGAHAFTAARNSFVTLGRSSSGAAPIIILHYGREVGGYPYFLITATSGTVKLRASYSETLAHVSITGDDTNTGIFGTGDPARYDNIVIRRPGTLHNRYIQGGERYEELTLTTPGTVSLRQVGIRPGRSGGTARSLRGWFLSSDRLLDRIWYAGVYTVSLDQDPTGTHGDTSAESNGAPLLLDGAKRDRIVWSANLLMTDPTVFYSLSPLYVRSSLRLIAERPMTPASLPAPAPASVSSPGPLAGFCLPFTRPAARCFGYSATYSMLFVPELYDYVLYTGDSSLLVRLWPLVERQLAWDAEHVDAAGLFSTTLSNGLDWNVDLHLGEGTDANAVYVLALRDAGRLAEQLDYLRLATIYRSRARAIARIVNSRLWDPAIGAYDASVTQRGVVVQDANVYAVLGGLASSDRALEVLGTLRRVLGGPYGPIDIQSPGLAGYTPVISPFISGSQVDDDFTHGMTAAAFSLMRREWGWMVTHDPKGVDWEKIGLQGKLGSLDSAAEGWSTGATSALSRYVLGVVPTSPGYATFSVVPQPGSLRWAEGSVPTPHGPITVRWARAPCSGMRLSVTVPAGTRSKISVPLDAGALDVTLDGRRVWRRAQGRRRARQGRGTLASIGPGDHQIVADDACH